MKTNKLTCGLFMYRGKNFWRNIKDIPIFFKRIVLVLKHGYFPMALWEFDEYFIDIMKELLEWHRDDSYGTPIFSMEESDEWNKAKWDSILNRMIELLDFMDERNPIYHELCNFKDHEAMKENAKEEFFKIFCEHFNSFWD